MKELKWRTENVLGVDMESSALLTVSKYYNIPAVSILMVSDKHNLNEVKTWDWGSDIFKTKKEEFLSLIMNYFNE